MAPIGGAYRRCRQQTYVLVCAAVTVFLLLAHTLTLDRPSGDDAAGRGAPAVAGGGDGDGSNNSPPGRWAAPYGRYEEAPDAAAADRSQSAGAAGRRVDRFVEGGRPLSPEEMAQRNAEWKVDQALKVSVDEGSVVARSARGDAGEDGDGADRGGTEVPYLHCGPMHGLGVAVGGPPGGPPSGPRSAFDRAAPPRELLLLHDSRFTKEDWRISGALDSLCLMGKGLDERSSLSVTAVDLTAEAGPLELVDAVEALRGAGVLSSRPVFAVSPGASGAAVVGLGELAVHGSARTENENVVSDGGADGTGERERDAESTARRRLGLERKSPPGGVRTTDLLRRTVRGWIAVSAGPAVLSASAFALRAFSGAGVPVMAVFGADDPGGRKAVVRLVVETGAVRTKMEGGDACYLDGPDGFVRAVLEFVEGACREQESGGGAQ